MGMMRCPWTVFGGFTVRVCGSSAFETEMVRASRSTSAHVSARSSPGRSPV